MDQVEKHFGLGKKELPEEDLVMKKVDKNTELAGRLIRFVE